MKLALGDVRMQPRGLGVNIDQSILIPRDDYDGHFQLIVFIAEVQRVWDPQRRLLG